MKNFHFFLILLLLSWKGYSQNIDVLKFNHKEVSMKLANNDTLHFSLPLKFPYEFEIGDLKFANKTIYKNNEKIGTYSKSRYKFDLENGTQMCLFVDDNIIKINNGKRKNEEVIYAQPELIFNENFGYLEKISVNEINYKDQNMTQAMVILYAIEKLTNTKSSKVSDDYMLGIVVGGLLSQ